MSFLREIYIYFNISDISVLGFHLLYIIVKVGRS